MEEKMVKINISELKAHPDNERIYGVEDISDLKSSLINDGRLFIPLKITSDNVIISGHRRWRACRELVDEGYSEFSEINCIVESYDTPEAMLKEIIMSNSYRAKNGEQIGREVIELIKLHSPNSEKRMKSGKKADTSDPVENLPQGKGKTRDIVSDILKMTGIKISPKNVDVLKKAITMLDEREAEGKTDDVELIRYELRKKSLNYNAIKDIIDNIDTLSKEEKKDICSGKVTINTILKQKQKQSDNTDNNDYYNSPKPKHKKQTNQVYEPDYIDVDPSELKPVNLSDLNDDTEFKDDDVSEEKIVADALNTLKSGFDMLRQINPNFDAREPTCVILQNIADDFDNYYVYTSDNVMRKCYNPFKELIECLNTCVSEVKQSLSGVLSKEDVDDIVECMEVRINNIAEDFEVFKFEYDRGMYNKRNAKNKSKGKKSKGKIEKAG